LRAKWTPRGWSRDARWCSRVIQEDRSGRTAPFLLRERRRRGSQVASVPNGKGTRGGQPKRKRRCRNRRRRDDGSQSVWKRSCEPAWRGGCVASQLLRTSQGRARGFASPEGTGRALAKR
jgi:hypothetical protein